MTWRPHLARLRATAPIGLLAISLWLLVGAAPTQAAGTVLVGDQKIETGNDSDSAGMAEAFRATATATGTLATLTAYVSSTSTATKLVVGIYASNGTNTHPTTLLAQGSISAPVKGAWNTVALTTQPQITSATPYWITILSPSGAGTVAFRDVLGGGLSETSAQASLASLPSSWSTGTVYKDGPISVYGTSTVTPDTTPPTPPSGLAVTGRTTTSFTASWTASNDNVGVTGYDVYRGGLFLGTTPGTSYTFTGLECGTAYTVSIDAFDAAGNVSTQSGLTASTSACPDTSPPTPPADLAQTAATTSSVSLAWTGSIDDVGVAGYGIYVNGALKTSTPATSAAVGNLICGTSYTIAVDAFDAAGNRSSRTSATMATASCPPDTTAPSIPDGLVITGATPTSLSLSWNASTDDVGVAGYNLFVDNAAKGSTGTTSTTFTNLACGSSYMLGVSAYDAAGNTSAAAAIGAQTSACPDTTPPTVVLTAPTNGTTISGTVPVSASAGDDVGVAGVQFKVDGVNLGAEDTSAPYGASWNTTGVANGSHTLTAVARDAAGNIATSTGVAVTVTNALAQPTPYPAANTNGVTVGPGYVDAGDHELMRTSAGVVYVAAADDDPCQIGQPGVIHMWKGIGAQPGNNAVPTSFSEMDTAHHPVSGGNNICQYTGGTNSALYSPDSRLDPAGIVHMVYIDTYTRNLYYQTFSTVTDTWGPRSLIATYADRDSGFSWPRGGQAALTLDANNAPHVIYASDGAGNQIYATDRVSGSWSTPARLFAGTNEMLPSLTTALDGTIHAAWVDNAEATHPVIKYARYSGGAWGPVETVSAGDASVLSDSNGDGSLSVATDRSGRPYVSYLDGTVNGTNDYVRIRYRTSAGVWTDDSPPGTAGGPASPVGTLFAHSPQVYVSQADDVFVFLGHDSLISPGGYAYQLGGPGGNWSPYATIDPRNKNNTTAGYAGLDGSASTRYDPLRDNNPNIIDLLYYDEHDGTPGYFHHATLYYKAVQLH